MLNLIRGVRPGKETKMAERLSTPHHIIRNEDTRISACYLQVTSLPLEIRIADLNPTEARASNQ